MSWWRPAYELRGRRQIRPCQLMSDEMFDRFLAPVMAQVVVIAMPANDRDGKRW